MLLQQAQNIRAVALHPWLMIPGLCVILARAGLQFPRRRAARRLRPLTRTLDPGPSPRIGGPGAGSTIALTIALRLSRIVVETAVNEADLLERISVDPRIYGGKPIIRGRRLAVEHVLGMLAAGDDHETLLQGYPWLEREDILACLVYARRLVGRERIEPLLVPGDG